MGGQWIGDIGVLSKCTSVRLLHRIFSSFMYSIDYCDVGEDQYYTLLGTKARFEMSAQRCVKLRQGKRRICRHLD